MNSYLDELYAHQEWADAEHWRAMEGHPAALADKAIRERLLHIHLVQHGFLWVTSPQRPEFAFKKLEDFPSMAELKVYARQGLNELGELLKQTDQGRMEEIIESAMVQAAREDQRASGSHAGGDAQSLSSRAERDAIAGIGGCASDDGFHRVAEGRATGGAVELMIFRRDVARNVSARQRLICGWTEDVASYVSTRLDYSETLCSSFCARSTRSTEYGARRLGSW